MSAPRELTSREKEVMNLVLQGKQNKEIAQELAIKESTLEKHLTHIYLRLGARNRTEAAFLYAKLHSDNS